MSLSSFKAPDFFEKGRVYFLTMQKQDDFQMLFQSTSNNFVFKAIKAKIPLLYLTRKEWLYFFWIENSEYFTFLSYPDQFERFKLLC